MTSEGARPYPMIRRYVVAIAKTIKRIDEGDAEPGDHEAMDELEEYFDRLDNSVHETLVRGALMQAAREEMQRQGGERPRPGPRLVQPSE